MRPPLAISWRSRAARGGSTRPRERSGFSHSDYITRSYGYLYLAYCRERRTRPKDMLFTPKKLKRVRKNKNCDPQRNEAEALAAGASLDPIYCAREHDPFPRSHR